MEWIKNLHKKKKDACRKSILIAAVEKFRKKKYLESCLKISITNKNQLQKSESKW